MVQWNSNQVEAQLHVSLPPVGTSLCLDWVPHLMFQSKAWNSTKTDVFVRGNHILVCVFRLFDRWVNSLCNIIPVKSMTEFKWHPFMALRQFLCICIFEGVVWGEGVGYTGVIFSLNKEKWGKVYAFSVYPSICFKKKCIH